MQKVVLVALGCLVLAAACAGPQLTRYAKSGDSERGKCSWYGERHHGRRTASGEPFDMNAMTAAHKKLPMGTIVRMTNLENGQQVTVRVNDRGPGKRGWILDLAKGAAEKADYIKRGVVSCSIEVVSMP